MPPAHPAADDAVVLEPLRVEDAAEMAGVLSDPALYAFTGGEPPTEDELRRRYALQVTGRSLDGTERWLNWVVRLAEDGRAIGYTQSSVDLASGVAELAWVVGTPWQGRGLAARAVTRMMEELQRDGVVDFVAHVHPEHAASAAVARRVGLRPTDRLVDGEVEWVGLSAG